MEYRRCHICALPSSLDVLKCSCGHSYCGACECPPPGAIVTSGDSVECIESVLKREDVPLMETKAKEQSSDREISTQDALGQQTAGPKPKQQLTHEGVHQRETLKSHRSCSKEQHVSIPVMFPDQRLEEVTCSHGTRGTRPKRTTLHDSSSVFQQVTVASETVKSVRGPPVPTADALLPIHSLSTLPSGMQLSQVQSQTLRHNDCHQQEDCHHRGSHSSSSPNLGPGSSSASCHSSGCHATHQGHRPYRHSITCTRKRRRYPEDTDSGYVAGASHLEEFGFVQSTAEPQRRCESQLNGHKKQGKQQLYSYQTESSSPREKTNVHSAIHSLNPVSVPKPHMEMKSPGWLTDDTVIPLQVRNRQETSTTQSNQSRPDVRMILSRKYEQEDPMKIASQPSRNVHQPQSKHSNDNCTEAKLQDFRNTMKSVPITAVGENHPEYGTIYNEDLTTDTSPYLPGQPLGDLSPLKSQPASRRLSAFFKLQEQNIVSLLNKRLQQHQNELKRLDRMSNDKPKVAVRKMSLNQEQDQQVNKLEEEFEERDSESKYDNDLSSLTLQAGERGNAFGTGSHDEMQDTASDSARSNMKKEQLAEDHGCIWNRMASKKQESPGPQISAKNGNEEASESGIKGITIVIHLEGREDVVIRTDLSQRI